MSSDTKNHKETSVESLPIELACIIPYANENAMFANGWRVHEQVNSTNNTHTSNQKHERLQQAAKHWQSHQPRPQQFKQIHLKIVQALALVC